MLTNKKFCKVTLFLLDVFTASRYTAFSHSSTFCHHTEASKLKSKHKIRYYSISIALRFFRHTII